MGITGVSYQLVCTRGLEILERNRFLNRHKLPKLSHKDIKNLSRVITQKETGSLIKKKKSWQRNIQDQMASLLKFNKILKNNECHYFSNSFRVVSIMLQLKPHKERTKEENIMQKSCVNINTKLLSKTLTDWI